MVGYAQKLIGRFSQSGIKHIHVTDQYGTVIASSQQDLLGTKCRTVLLALNDPDDFAPRFTRSESLFEQVTPLLRQQQADGFVVVAAESDDKAKIAAQLVVASLEGIAGHEAKQRKPGKRVSREELIVREIFSDRRSEEDTSGMSSRFLRKLGFDLLLLRSVILIEMEQKSNRYFNINLDLGYETSTENFKDKVLETIRANRYLNNQDIVAFKDGNHIVIIKSFLSVNQYDQIYNALDKICTSILADLDASKIFSCRIAYGKICSSYPQLRESYIEAQNTLRLGTVFWGKPGLHNLEDTLVEHVGLSLSPVVGDKLIRPILDKLRRKDGTLDLELLATTEAFVDNNFNLVAAANKLFLHRNTVALKITKFREKTGLDVQNSFGEAFLAKMVVVYSRLHPLEPTKN